MTHRQQARLSAFPTVGARHAINLPRRTDG